MDDHPVTRRKLLVGLATIALGSLPGCDDGGETTVQAHSSPGVQTADTMLAYQLISDKEYLLGRYTEAVTSHPELAVSLRAFVRRHEAHVDAVAAAIPVPNRPTSPLAGGWATPSPWPSPPGDPAIALRSLADAEEAASGQRSLLVSSAASGRLAVLLAAIAACEAGHAVLLRERAG